MLCQKHPDFLRIDNIFTSASTYKSEGANTWWLGYKNRNVCIDFMHDMSTTYDHSIQVTFHAIDIFDKIISYSERPTTDLREFLTYTSAISYLLAAKMNGRYPPNSEMTLDYNVTEDNLKSFELFILDLLNWNIHSGYAFLSIDFGIPTEMRSRYEKLMMKSYRLFQVRKYSVEVIKQAILSVLYDNCQENNKRNACEIELRQESEQDLEQDSEQGSKRQKIAEEKKV